MHLSLYERRGVIIFGLAFVSTLTNSSTRPSASEMRVLFPRSVQLRHRQVNRIHQRRPNRIPPRCHRPSLQVARKSNLEFVFRYSRRFLVAFAHRPLKKIFCHCRTFPKSQPFSNPLSRRIKVVNPLRYGERTKSVQEVYQRRGLTKLVGRRWSLVWTVS